MNPHHFLGFYALLAESSSLGRFINFILLWFSAAGLPALLGLLALWLGRPRASWAPFALVLGVISVVLGGLSLRIVRAMEESRPWFSADWKFYAAARLPLLLGLRVCAWAWRCWRQPHEPASLRS